MTGSQRNGKLEIDSARPVAQRMRFVMQFGSQRTIDDHRASQCSLSHRDATRRKRLRMETVRGLIHRSALWAFSGVCGCLPDRLRGRQTSPVWLGRALCMADALRVIDTGVA